VRLPLECRICGTNDIEQLVRNKSLPGGRQRICRECHAGNGRMEAKESAYTKASRKRRNRDWWAENQEKGRECVANYQRSIRSKPPKPELAALASSVWAWRQAAGYTRKGLAKAIGMPHVSLEMRERGYWRFKAADLAKLQALGWQGREVTA
jgi:hypothetical protein